MLTSPTDIQIRPAHVDDLPAVTALLRASDLEPNELEVQFGPQFAVAVDPVDGSIIGAAGVELYRDGADVVGLFRSAAVDDAWRGRGVGKALTDDRIAWAERQAVHTLYLLTQTAADYWPRFGFTRTARDAAPEGLMASHEWKSGCPASAVAMTLPLPRR
jgi:amino-acid N-acetyltransferase